MSLRIALAGGTPLPATLRLLEAAGVPLAPLRETPGRPLHQLADGSLAVLAPAADVPLLVERGAADVGVVGKEMLVELDCDVYELLDLRAGTGRLVFALPAGAPDVWAADGGWSRVTIATRFPETTRRYFEESGRQVEVVSLQGAVELAPRLRLADAVVDLVRSGRTLAAAGLEAREVLAECSQRLIAGRAAHALRAAEIGRLVSRLRALREGSTADGGAAEGAA